MKNTISEYFFFYTDLRDVYTAAKLGYYACTDLHENPFKYFIPSLIQKVPCDTSEFISF